MHMMRLMLWRRRQDPQMLLLLLLLLLLTVAMMVTRRVLLVRLLKSLVMLIGFTVTMLMMLMPMIGPVRTREVTGQLVVAHHHHVVNVIVESDRLARGVRTSDWSSPVGIQHHVVGVKPRSGTPRTLMMIHRLLIDVPRLPPARHSESTGDGVGEAKISQSTESTSPSSFASPSTFDVVVIIASAAASTSAVVVSVASRRRRRRRGCSLSLIHI